jgi:regulator of replication initiation timing
MISQDNPDAPLSFQESKVLVQENNDLRFENAQFKRSMKDKEERIGELFEKLAGAMQRIAELEEAVKKTSFISAKDVTTESQISIDNSKYRILLATRTVPVSVTQTGEYIIYSDPVKKILELRRPSPKP